MQKAPISRNKTQVPYKEKQRTVGIHKNSAPQKQRTAHRSLNKHYEGIQLEGLEPGEQTAL